MMPMKLMTAFSNLRNKRESPGQRAETIHHQTCWWAAWTHPGRGYTLGPNPFKAFIKEPSLSKQCFSGLHTL